jgi:protein SCO1
MKGFRFFDSLHPAIFPVAVAVAGFFINPEIVTAADQTAGPRYEQKIGAVLPLSTVLRDEAGVDRPVSAYFDHEPVVLLFGYWNCPELCSVVAGAAVDSLRQIRPTSDNRFTLLYVSIDPKENPNDARQAKERDLRHFAHAGEEGHWHYLTGDEASLKAFASAAGFHYRYDSVSRQFAHPSGFLIATPQGVVSRYFLGLDFSPAEVDQALHQARAGQTGTSVFDLLLLCFRGNGISGPYGVIIWRALQIAVFSTVALVAGGIAWMIYQEKRRPRQPLL